MFERRLIDYYELYNVGGRLRAINNDVAQILSRASVLPQVPQTSDRLMHFLRG